MFVLDQSRSECKRLMELGKRGMGKTLGSVFDPKPFFPIIAEAITSYTGTPIGEMECYPKTDFDVFGPKNKSPS
jgi:hypothetical protein